MHVFVEISMTTQPNDWDHFVCALGGNIFHSSIWAEYLRDRGMGEPVYLMARSSDGRYLGGALGLFRKSQRPLFSMILREFELTSHPFGFQDARDVLADFLDHCEGIASDMRCSSLILGSNMSGDSSFIPNQFGYEEFLRLEFHVDLQRDRDELWSAVAKDQRDRVRTLSRKGIYVEEGEDRKALTGLQMVRENTQTKRAQRGQGYKLAEQDLYDSLYDRLLAKGAARLFVARHEGAVIAALFFSTFNRQAYSVFSGSTDYGYKTGAQSGLFWRAVETFKGEDYWRLNRGGVPASASRESDPLHGIYRFKKRLGTVPVVCRSGEKVVNRLAYAIKEARKLLPF